jgi:hypothetical protein
MNKSLKTKLKSAINTLLGRKKSIGYVQTVPAVISCYSQAHVLRYRMEEQNMTHGQNVIANLYGVRLESYPDGKFMYFCPTQEITILEKIEDGDGGRIPEELTIHGPKGEGTPFEIPVHVTSGLYEVRNVRLYSNGTIQVHATSDTEFAPL